MFRFEPTDQVDRWKLTIVCDRCGCCSKQHTFYCPDPRNSKNLETLNDVRQMARLLDGFNVCSTENNLQDLCYRCLNPSAVQLNIGRRRLPVSLPVAKAALPPAPNPVQLNVAKPTLRLAAAPKPALNIQPSRQLPLSRQLPGV